MFVSPDHWFTVVNSQGNNRSTSDKFPTPVVHCRATYGKLVNERNALSPQVLRETYSAPDRAESDQAIAIMTGRESVFSAGFDLNMIQRGGTNALGMLRTGYALTARVMAYPY